jgi:EAL domain-containing protein (putative c-di-GMP-specific phosphodiesterase class I)
MTDKLEITETALVEEFSSAVSVSLELKKLGVKIAMDDFGSGFSSLSYLHAFPFDKIKIDKSFVSQLQTNSKAPTIIRTIIGLAHGLSLPTLAEGVENEKQFAFLKREGCDEIQGYFIGVPKEIGHYADIAGKADRLAASERPQGKRNSARQLAP